MRLPFHGVRRVLQGVGGRFSHTGRDRFAWDFAMAEGTPVLAADGGIVVEIVDDFDRGGPNRGLAERANVVVIDHGGDRFSLYQHLLRGASCVRAGERVARGQRIARSGSSGFTTHPHLHFEITDYRNRSRPACFDEVPGGVPLVGACYRSGNSWLDLAGAVSLTQIPRHAFSVNGVLLEVDLPARFLAAPPSLTITGRLLFGLPRVYAFFLPRGSERACAWFGARADRHGRFTIELPLSSLRGKMSFAMAATRDHHFHSDFSVPCALS
jgi:murein DD-endopeptidase MepM/ murein hydrolase activator NlpD